MNKEKYLARNSSGFFICGAKLMCKFRVAIILNFLLLLAACTPQAAIVTPNAISSNETAPPLTSTPVPTITSTPTEIPLTERNWDTLTLEEKKTVIELNDDGDNIYDTVELEDGSIEFFNSETGEIETLEPLVGTNGEVIPFGEIYDLSNPDDVSKLKAILNHENYLRGLDWFLENEITKIITFYPTNWQEWRVMKPGEEYFEMSRLDGYTVLENNGEIKVVKITISPTTRLSVANENSGAQLNSRGLQKDNEKMYPGLIFLDKRDNFTPGSDGLSETYFGTLSREQAENEFLGGEDVGKENFIQLLNEGRMPVVSVLMELNYKDNFHISNK